MAEHLDGALISRWARRATAGLMQEQATINGLNVFPIPDSDTGTNMARTMKAAVAALDELKEADLVAVTSALALGAVRGARGNSGLILSQFLRAMAEVATQGPIDGRALATVLGQAAHFAREAISSPVEGTIISVLAAAAEGARSVPEGATLDEVVDQTLSAAKAALDMTTQQLEALRQAGVVDAGAYGFVLLLFILRDVLDGAPDVPEVELQESSSTQEVEVMFSFTVESAEANGAIVHLREYMEELGNSVVVGTVSDTEATMHVHTTTAGPIIEKAYELGKVRALRIEVLPEQPAVEETLSAALPIIAMCPVSEGQRGVVELFEKLGAYTVISGEEGRKVLESIAGPTLVLVNGQDDNAFRGIATQRSAAQSPLEFIDTGSVVGGLAALAVFDSSAEWEDTVDDVLSAISSQRWMGTDPVNPVEGERLTADITDMLDQGGELLTVLWDDGDDRAGDVATAVDMAMTSVGQKYPEVEVQTIHISGLGMPVQIGVE